LNKGMRRRLEVGLSVRLELVQTMTGLPASATVGSRSSVRSLSVANARVSNKDTYGNAMNSKLSVSLRPVQLAWASVSMQEGRVARRVRECNLSPCVPGEGYLFANTHSARSRLIMRTARTA
jgi:hypothetical protein